jgi:hypothetical protein
MGDPPTWKSRRKKQGKLKAEELLTLFSVILPLVLLEMELDNDPNRHQAMLNSFSDLVGATNIIASFKTSSSAADTFIIMTTLSPFKICFLMLIYYQTIIMLCTTQAF